MIKLKFTKQSCVIQVRQNSWEVRDGSTLYQHMPYDFNFWS